MANYLGFYDPYFYANEALGLLYKQLGFARLVHRGYDKTPTQKGSTIRIRKPSSFSVEDMPGSGQDITTGEIEVVVDKWRGNRWSINDKELSFTQEDIIREHIEPAVMAIAEDVDTKIAELAYQIPWYYAAAATAEVKDLTQLAKVMTDNKVPKGMRALAINSERSAGFQELPTFHQANTGANGVETQREGYLGRKFGFDIFENQSIVSTTAGALASVTQLQINAAAAVGATSLVFKDSDGALSGTIGKGATFTIAGSTQRYAVTAAATVAANVVTVNISPALQVAVSGNENVTLRDVSKALNLAFHPSAIALAMAPLSDIGAKLGQAKMAVAMDPQTGLALRSRMWYEGATAKAFISLDCLFGLKVLDPNRAARLES